ncbi:MAG: peptide chain release factor N(5)-glutamine methyltransferase, partial [Hymenobacteraceae bacterium]|nr:peptide chain release factor N(5)-glutamine methyltransferase [Hymenobacteraceae bacterium]
MPSIATFLRSFTADLAAAYDPAEARALARRVLGHRLGLAPHELALSGGKALSAQQHQRLTDDQRRLLANEPVQYILGTAPFLDLELEVGPGVLIPRPETEELVQLVVAEQRSVLTPRLLDVGTGSGCIAVALGQYLPRADVTGLDVSAEALTIARRNGQRYGDRVRWLQTDVFGELTRATLGGALDGLISNPPYVPQREAAALAPHVRDHEPALALFV